MTPGIVYDLVYVLGFFLPTPVLVRGGFARCLVLLIKMPGLQWVTV